MVGSHPKWMNHTSVTPQGQSVKMAESYKGITDSWKIAGIEGGSETPPPFNHPKKGAVSIAVRIVWGGTCLELVSLHTL